MVGALFCKYNLVGLFELTLGSTDGLLLLLCGRNRVSALLVATVCTVYRQHSWESAS